MASTPIENELKKVFTLSPEQLRQQFLVRAKEGLVSFNRTIPASIVKKDATAVQTEITHLPGKQIAITVPRVEEQPQVPPKLPITTFYVNWNGVPVLYDFNAVENED